MKSNPLIGIGDRLGWFAYVTVMGGGKPYWPALFSPESDDQDAQLDLGDEAERPVRPRDPFAGTMPLEITPNREQNKQREEQIAAA